MITKPLVTYLSAYTLVGMRKTPFAFSALTSNVSITARVKPNVVKEILASKKAYKNNSAKLTTVIGYYETATCLSNMEYSTHDDLLNYFRGFVLGVSVGTIVVPDSTHCECLDHRDGLVVCADYLGVLNNPSLREHVVTEQFVSGLPVELQKHINNNSDPLLYLTNPTTSVHKLRSYYNSISNT